jgi:phytoene dehydrogenase-like protein
MTLQHRGGAERVGVSSASPSSPLHPYATGVDGVFLCSAATPPGAGAHGMSEYWAAQAALRKVRTAK